MLVKLRYVTRRVNRRDGSERWYWQRKGHPLTRLPDDPVKRFELATRLNAAADRKEGEALVEGSIGWVIQKYRASDAYKKLQPGTLKYYNRYLAEIETKLRGVPFADFDRRMVIDFIETYTGIGENRKVAAVLRNLFNTALYYRVAPTNHCDDLRLSTTKARDVCWQPDHVKAFLEAAALHHKGEAITVAFQLLHYTAQRPSDVLAMTWAKYNGDVIQLRQQKTNKLIAVPCHRDLRDLLAEQRRRLTSTGEGKTVVAAAPTIVAQEGRPLSYPVFNRAWVEICMAAGLENLQARDLRRTACVRMAEAGATEKQIAAVTGHTIETTRQILETYIPTTVEMARGAITKLERGGA